MYWGTCNVKAVSGHCDTGAYSRPPHLAFFLADVVEGNFTKYADGRHGFLPYGTAWYRKNFTLAAGDDGSVIRLLFDGIYMRSDVWVNGLYVGHHESGYTSFHYRISNVSALLNYGGSNLLAIHTDSRAPEVRQLRHPFRPSLRDVRALCHPTHAV